jgi:hypothetical protein
MLPPTPLTLHLAQDVPRPRPVLDGPVVLERGPLARAARALAARLRPAPAPPAPCACTAPTGAPRWS